jgi:hypothetical protein
MFVMGSRYLISKKAKEEDKKRKEKRRNRGGKERKRGENKYLKIKSINDRLLSSALLCSLFFFLFRSALSSPNSRLGLLFGLE